MGRGADAIVRPSSRLLTAWAVVALPWLWVPAAAAQQAPSEPVAQTPSRDLEDTPEPPAPVLLGGEPVVWITAGSGHYSPTRRAARISERLEEAVHDFSIRDPTVTVIEAEGASELKIGSRLLMVVSARDAAAIGAPRATLAAQNARDFEAAIRAERLRYAPRTLILSGAYGLVATMMLVALLWLIGRITRWLGSAVGRFRERRLASVRVQDAELIPRDKLRRLTDASVRMIRLVLIVLVIDVYLTFVLGLFPWTRAASLKLLDYALTPLRAAAVAFVGYLPKLLFVLVIVAIIYSAIRLVGLFFDQVGRGRIVLRNFPEEWAKPTNTIVRVLLIAFGLVVSFPYLPASDSPAFAGVSVLMGVLFSLASSSSLSNMIAGLVLTYTGAFRLGDRVKIGDAFGDIIETALLATHVRTIKNEVVVIPNGVVLATPVTNYTRAARTRGLILHTAVTIGYNAPWRTIHDLLLKAADATAGVLKDPKPFVWQTSLNDFYVTYEINAYTDLPGEMPDIYARLHANIQDTFYAAGIEIMSPHFTALRDGNTVAIPEAQRPAGYRAGAFHVVDAARQAGS